MTRVGDRSLGEATRARQGRRALTAVAFALTALRSGHLISGELDAAASLTDDYSSVVSWLLVLLFEF
jgi:hypothetical protein